jgi:GNAT superfamily N-acetyltransferase
MFSQVKYTKEVFRDEYDMTYRNAREYQAQLTKALNDVFGENSAINEWDSVEFDGHTHNHKSVYAPRIDIAIAPFNSYFNLDAGIDKTGSMRNHLFVKKLEERADIVWNNFSRCFLAIEIVFSGSSKHIAGDILNAASTGSIGIVVAHDKIYNKVNRISSYFTRLVGYQRMQLKGLKNLMVFREDDFLEFLWELKNLNKVAKKLKIENKYRIAFKKYLLKSFFISAHTSKYKPQLSQNQINRLIVSGFDVKEIIEQHDIVLSPTQYTCANTVNVYELIELNGKRIRIMDIVDIAVMPKFRNKGIGTKILKIFERIAKDNKCNFICVELGYDHLEEPIELQKNFFVKNNFKIWHDKRAQFNGWVGKKELN